MTGKFELHVFVEPLNPPADTVDAFRAACAGTPETMKALLLNLDYVGKGFVGVLQSSRYVDGDIAMARAAVRRDADLLRAAGLRVIREKVEALSVNDGVPRDADEARRSPPDRYFEFHVLIDGRDGPISENDMRSLRELSAEFGTKLRCPVPLSYNAMKPSQRFLNLRARGVGLAQAMKPVQELMRAIEHGGTLEVKKVISEYICFDSNRAVDNGWLEPVDGPAAT